MQNGQFGYADAAPNTPMLSDDLAEQVDTKQGLAAPLKYDGRTITQEEKDFLDR